MDEFTAHVITGGVGVVIGSYFTAKYLAFVTRKKRYARKGALREIASHQWGNGGNDAIIITRIALKGLDDE